MHKDRSGYARIKSYLRLVIIIDVNITKSFICEDWKRTCAESCVWNCFPWRILLNFSRRLRVSAKHCDVFLRLADLWSLRQSGTLNIKHSAKFFVFVCSCYKDVNRGGPVLFTFNNSKTTLLLFGMVQGLGKVGSRGQLTPLKFGAWGQKMHIELRPTSARCPSNLNDHQLLCCVLTSVIITCI